MSATASPAADPANDPAELGKVNCNAESRTVSLALPPGAEDRVTPGWSVKDQAIRIGFVSEGQEQIKGGKTCYGGSDILDGGPGADEVRSYGGNDRVLGGPGEDFLFGGDGRDRIDALDGEADLVLCGGGGDSAEVDRIDDVRPDCERIVEG